MIRLMQRLYQDWIRRAIPWVSLAVVLLLLLLLYLISDALRSADRLESLFLWLLGGSAIGLLFLVAVVAGHIFRLVRNLRRGVIGSRLTARLVLTFVALSAIPVVIVFYFSLNFIQRGIDSWFDVRVDQAMTDALALSRLSFDGHMRDAMDQTRRAASTLQGEEGGDLLALTLHNLRQTTNAREMTIFGSRNLILASSTDDPRSIVPSRPDETALAHARSGKDYISLDPGPEGDLRIRVVVPIRAGLLGSQARVLNALFTLPPEATRLSNNVQAALSEYRELIYLHESLKQTFSLALVLALILSLLTAIWLAFVAARHLLAPIQELAEGTRAVAQGNYEHRLRVDRRDDLGLLVQSFNAMIARVRRAHRRTRELRELADHERDYLETVLDHLSSGVLTLDADGRINRANEVAAQLLSVPRDSLHERTLAQLCAANVHLRPLCEAFDVEGKPGSAISTREAQIRIMGDTGRRILLSRVASLPEDGQACGGRVLVVEDVTTLIQAQRDAAWSEVARRLAHEIKNPLTPIQLSAERMRRRLLDKIPGDEVRILDRATQTIIQQVEAMKVMVNEFTEYARSPQPQLESMDLVQLARDVVDLYKGHEVRVRLRVHAEALVVTGDAGRLRQLLHNLIRNAQQALAESEPESPPQVTVVLGLHEAGQLRQVEMLVADNGPGFPEDMLDTIFEPYVTTRPRGTGLGLAIVKKIVEEHGGMVCAYNVPASGDGGEPSGNTGTEAALPPGARVLVRLPPAAAEQVEHGVETEK
ncbi:MAG: ATP-binding protein [Halothiobacillaceae bacterium]